MIRVNIICEGPTEQKFVQKLLYPYFLTKGIAVAASRLDGGFNYGRLKHHIVQMLNSDHGAYVTTMVDLYGLKGEYPGYEANKHRPAPEKAAAIEAAILADVLAARNLHNHQFIPYMQLHEFEALLFSDAELMEEWLSLDHAIPENCFGDILAGFDTPEHINDSPLTAPSKRILALVPSYEKIDDGVLIAEDIGLEKIRAKCPHFDAWMKKLESLAPQSQ